MDARTGTGLLGILPDLPLSELRDRLCNSLELTPSNEEQDPVHTRELGEERAVLCGWH